ncbi:MAG TPA: TetR/AcrR family transcriptional regulator [Chitinophagales bacterium]|nr:TetR/AcrR family transcriptional regulator [Chitinophagales bacterium]
MAASVSNTRLVIRQKAEKLFREKGYAAVGMRELAKEVGIEAPSIYNHYKSKDDVLREICFDIADQFFKAFGTVDGNEKSSVKKLRAAIRSHVGVIANNIEASSVFFHEWMFLEEPHLAKFKKMRFDYEQGFRDIIERGKKKGDFKNVNTRLATFTIFSALNATYDLYKSKEKLSTEEIADGIADVLLKGLKG